MIPSRDSRRIPSLGEFQLDSWSVHQDKGTLSCADRVVRLEPRVMDVLVYLAADPGAVVTKEELLEAVWGGSFVEEGALSQAIHNLRKALGDDARQPRFIETIPKRGYRLVAPVVRAEATPEPIAPETRPSRRREWLLVGAAVLAAVLVALWINWTRPGPRIVVLPFEDLSQPGVAYFSQGLTDEITENLDSPGALQVISRRSAMFYAGKQVPISEIARELNVDYVLDGTVQWDVDSKGRRWVRIRAQLTRTADETQVWSKSFDSEVEVEDTFAVQSEISRQVNSQLGVALTKQERQAMDAPPTKNLDAYQAYLRGQELRRQPYYSAERVLDATYSFKRATELDPTFAAAWAELSQAHCHLAFNTDRSPDRVQTAKEALQRAIDIDPGLKSVWLARIDFAYRCQESYDDALTEVTAAVERFPNDAEVLQKQGFILRRRGRFREAADALSHAFWLDPKAAVLVFETAETFRALRNYQKADRFYQKAISMVPDEPYYWEERALNEIASSGDVAAARKILAEAPMPADEKLLVVSVRLDLYARDYRKALSRLTPEKVRALPDLERYQLSILEVLARERVGDRRGALALAEANRAELQALVKQYPKEPFFPAFLAITLAQLGRTTEAADLARKVSGANRHDGFGGPNVVEFQAMTEAILGRDREAVQILSGLLETPYRWAISVHDLRLNPIWDPLRESGEFKNLVRQFS